MQSEQIRHAMDYNDDAMIGLRRYHFAFKHFILWLKHLRATNIVYIRNVFTR